MRTTAGTLGPVSAVPRFDPQQLLAHDVFVRELARRLVGDGAAEDLAQDTWLSALAAPAQPLSSLRGWLATVARRTAGKRVRTEQRRRRREARAANGDPASPVAELVEREEARAAVVRAVLELPSPYRDVVVLRWFDGLPPRAIARQLAVPVDTVRTRHRRALEQLRAVLDAHQGGRRSAWTALLLPLATPRRAAVAGAMFGGIVLMSTKLKLAVAAAGAAVIAFACWALAPSAPAPFAPPGGARPAAAEPMRGELPGPVNAAPATTAMREAVAAPNSSGNASTATTGTAVVTVVWSDRTPAPGVQVLLGGDRVRQTIVSDDDGIARFEALEPGEYRTGIERGEWADAQPQRFSLTAGAESAVELVVADGLDLTGIVVDGEGHGIADAAIVVAPRGSGSSTVVARAAADGRFSARDVAVDCCVGATATDLAPSLLQQMTGSVGGTAQVRIVLGAGATITGTVFGPDGRPAPGMRVLIGPPAPDYVRLADGSRARPPAIEARVTDRVGRFDCGPLLPGPHRLLVDAEGLAPWTGDVELTAGQRTDVVVHLQAGATFRGVVRDAAGNPVTKARVTVLGGSELSRSVASGPDGSYELTGASAGELTLRAKCRDARELVRTFEVVPGQVVVWDPVLPVTTMLRGRAVDHEGHPVAGADVSASQSDNEEGPWSVSARTDDDGRFHLDGCEPGVPMSVTVRRGQFDVVNVAAVVPGDEEVLVSFPAPTAVRIRGTVLDDRGAPLPNVGVQVVSGRCTAREHNAPDSGAFEFGPYPAGEYRLILRANGFAPLRVPARALTDGDTWDVGALRMQRGGNLRATFVGGSTFADRYVEITFASGAFACGENSARGALVVGPLTAGDYLMHVRGEDIACQIVPFAIRDGVDTVLDVPVRTGTATVLTFAVPAGVPPPHELLVTITAAASGLRCYRNQVWNENGLALPAMLPPGRYLIEATGANKLRQTLAGSRALDVGTSPVAASLLLQLRD
ncbi:MAG TPA: sigma-70 family RNA polymerase sigma factor [Planctomycetota bacterium]|nr:sigma-70 family RNA polymerase sigma factor [Planctomycetota bacterium]